MIQELAKNLKQLILHKVQFPFGQMVYLYFMVWKLVHIRQFTNGSPCWNRMGDVHYYNYFTHFAHAICLQLIWLVWATMCLLLVQGRQVSNSLISTYSQEKHMLNIFCFWFRVRHQTVLPKLYQKIKLMLLLIRLCPRARRIHHKGDMNCWSKVSLLRWCSYLFNYSDTGTCSLIIIWIVH